VYGGVRNDWAALKMAASADATMTWPYLPFVAVDLPLSAVGDTLTLPYTLFVNSEICKRKLIDEPTDEFRALLSSPPPGER
jgi:hypothetical protein